MIIKDQLTRDIKIIATRLLKELTLLRCLTVKVWKLKKKNHEKTEN